MLNRTRTRLAFLTLLFCQGPGSLAAASPPFRARATQDDSGSHSPDVSTGAGFSRYLELRTYRTRAGVRDEFLDYFEKHYLESQEATGMRIWGQFRDLNVPDHFVWMRGYRTMEERQQGLLAFYTGAVWAETGPRVRDMLAERATHVHFLEPASPDGGFDDAFERADSQPDAGVVVAMVFRASEDETALIGELRRTLIPAFENRGAAALGLFRSSEEANNFPALPFLDERVVVWIASFGSRTAFEYAWQHVPSVPSPFELFVLEPGRRSRLYHRGG